MIGNRSDVTCRVGDQTYPVMRLPVMGGELTRDEGGGMRDEARTPLLFPPSNGGKEEETIITATAVARFLGAQWACRQDVPGIIYWIPKPAMDITREMRRLQHDLAEWRGEFENPARRATGRMGWMVLDVARMLGFGVHLLVRSYPCELIENVPSDLIQQA